MCSIYRDSISRQSAFASKSKSDCRDRASGRRSHFARLIGYDWGMKNSTLSGPKIRLRKLRIAWSVLAAGASIFLVAFWVQSFWRADDLIGAANGHTYELDSGRGELVFDLSSSGASYAFPWGCDHSIYSPRDVQIPENVLGFRFGLGDWIFMIPYWFVLLITAGIGIVPWMHCSFSLRTMLIAVTLIAGALGLAPLLHSLPNQRQIIL